MPKNIVESLMARDPKLLRPSIAQSARAHIDRVLQKRLYEDLTPSDGIFYVIRYPKGWTLFAYRYDEYPDTIDHSELWTEYCAPILAHNWAAPLKRPVRALEKAIAQHTYGFPRGRVSRNHRSKFTVHFGNDFLKLGISKNTVERAFTLNGVCKWERDEHEQCQKDDREALRSLFKLKETWPAVGASFGFGDDDFGAMPDEADFGAFN